MEAARKKVLIVDDEASIRDSLRLLLKGSFDVHVASDGVEALEVVDTVAPDLVLLDLVMPNLGGLDTLRKLRAKDTTLPVVMLTATNTVRTAVQAMKYGAIDYVNKPFDVEELTSIIVGALEERAADTAMQTPNLPSAATTLPEADFGPLVGRSSLMQELFARVTQVAERDTTVLITGESGTGKELVARQIHERSARAKGPFVAINCAAIPEALIESELFGHEKGAFTNAIERRLGHCELADGGTLFLDEIGELSLPVQVKMLRFLQEQEFYRVGRSKPVRVNVRIVAATNKDLERLVEEGSFRQDLYYRVNVIHLTIPPLRDRFEDIPGLVEHFVEKFSPQYGGKRLQFSAEAQRALVEHDWPGNVRELENVVESLLALCPGETIEVEDLPRRLTGARQQIVAPSANEVLSGALKFEEAERIFETEMIVKALKKTGYVQTRAAELLGISRRILKYKMDKLGISDRPSVDDGSVQPSAGEGGGALS